MFRRTGVRSTILALLAWLTLAAPVAAAAARLDAARTHPAVPIPRQVFPDNAVRTDCLLAGRIVMLCGHSACDLPPDPDWRKGPLRAEVTTRVLQQR